MNNKISKIAEWISEQGYPLEMYCENILSLNNFSVMQSLHYEDEETKKYREIDLLATRYFTLNGVTFNFSIVVECKLSRDKPWLLFSRRQHMDHKEEIIKDIFTTINGKLLMTKTNELNNLSLLNYDSDKIGFNLTQCFTSGKDIPYQAIMSTVNACEYLVNKSNTSKRPFCNFYFPVIVIDSEMYNCRTGLGEDLEIRSIEIGKLLSVRSYSDRPSILYTIVTKTGFKAFVENLSNEFTELFKNLTPAFQYVSDTRPSNPSPDYSFL